MVGSNLTDVKILGKKAVKLYRASSYDGEILENEKTIEHPIIWEGVLENPPFEEGQRIYIDKFEKEVYINKITRSTSNKYVYHTTHLAEPLIENEDTKKSYEEALIKSEEIIEKRKQEKSLESKPETLTGCANAEENNYDDIGIADVGVHLNKAIESLKAMQKNNMNDSNSEFVNLALNIQIILHNAKADILKAQQLTVSEIFSK